MEITLNRSQHIISEQYNIINENYDINLIKENISNIYNNIFKNKELKETYNKILKLKNYIKEDGKNINIIYKYFENIHELAKLNELIKLYTILFYHDNINININYLKIKDYTNLTSVISDNILKLRDTINNDYAFNQYFLKISEALYFNLNLDFI